MTNKDEKAKRFIKGSTIGVAIFGLLAIIVLGLLYLNGQMEIKKREADFQNRVSGFVNPFYNTDNKVEAKAAIVVDDESGIILYGKNIDEELPIASLTKLMSTLVAGQYLEQNNIEYTQIGNVNIQSVADYNFISGEQWATKDLLTAMLVSSSNVAAETLFNAITQSQINTGASGQPITLVAMMNEVARSFGFKNTRYLNSTGLDIKDTSVQNGYSFGGVSTAFEVARTANILESVFPELTAQTAQKEVELFSKDGIPHNFINTDYLVEKLPIYFSKTGFTDGAGGSLVVRTKVDDRFIYIVVLGSTKSGRFEDIEKLYNGSVVLFGDLKNRGIFLEDLQEHNLIGYDY